MSGNRSWRQELSNTFRPLRPNDPGLYLLLALIAACTASGLEHIALDYPGNEIHHAHLDLQYHLPDHGIYHGQPDFRNYGREGTVPGHLHQAMFENLIAAGVIGMLSAGLLYLPAAGTKHSNRY